MVVVAVVTPAGVAVAFVVEPAGADWVGVSVLPVGWLNGIAAGDVVPVACPGPVIKLVSPPPLPPQPASSASTASKTVVLGKLALNSYTNKYIRYK
jgi:hypothetical protein